MSCSRASLVDSGRLRMPQFDFWTGITTPQLPLHMAGPNISFIPHCLFLPSLLPKTATASAVLQTRMRVCHCLLLVITHRGPARRLPASPTLWLATRHSCQFLIFRSQAIDLTALHAISPLSIVAPCPHPYPPPPVVLAEKRLPPAELRTNMHPRVAVDSALSIHLAPHGKVQVFFCGCTLIGRTWETEDPRHPVLGQREGRPRLPGSCESGVTICRVTEEADDVRQQTRFTNRD